MPDCPFCDVARSVEEVKPGDYFCNGCAREFRAPALSAGNTGRPDL